MKRSVWGVGRAAVCFFFLGWLSAAEVWALPSAPAHPDLVHKLVDGYFVSLKVRALLEGVLPDWEKKGEALTEPLASLQREIAQVKEDVKAGVSGFDDQAQVTLSHARLMATFARLRSVFSRVQSALGGEASAEPAKGVFTDAIAAIEGFLSPTLPE